jgi:hypothetical protein
MRIGKKDTTPIPFKQEIADDIERLFKSGVKLKVIFDYIQKYDDAPRSYDRMAKLYKQVIASARADIQSEMGAVVIGAAREGDWKAAEFFLKTKAGWNQTIEVEEVDSEEKEETGAIDDLIALLGMASEDEEDEQGKEQ